ncbi:MAG: sulfatase-like hydrolase/transferase [Sedimentisphaerales bacterium]|nr:sulfatase-like hydrolase/transferase [Sedimentisphaerales bacterium]
MQNNINRRDFLKSSLLGTTGLASLSAFLPSSPLWARSSDEQNNRTQNNRPPDIIFFMTDQQRWDALGVLNPHIKTPTLDRLARNGILFQHAVCQAPMCVPSRNSMMFGLYPSQLGVRSNGSHSVGDAFLPFPPIPERLRLAGYQTAGFGKTHWGRIDTPISTRGFEVRVVGERGVGPENGARYQNDENPEGLAAYRREVATYGGGEERVEGYIGKVSEVAERDHRDGWVAEQCLKFLDSDVDPDRPLFLYLSFLKPHAGLNVPKRFEELYDIEDMPDMIMPPWSQEPDTHLAASDKLSRSHAGRHAAWREAFSKMTSEQRRRTVLRYYANCSWLEHYFGEALARLEKLGRLKNALIVFLSDHGEMLGERNFRFTKYCLYDSSVRVPLILSGSVVPEELRGTVDNRPAELVDIFPTLMKVAGAESEQELPGLDLLSDQQRTGNFCEYHDGLAPAYMWRKQDWKLILFFDRPLAEARLAVDKARGELYDLKNDPHEWHNLYGNSDYAEIREQMKTELLMHLACAWEGYPKGKG